MIRVTVELVSAVSPKRNRVLGVAEIANVGGDLRWGNYSVRLSKWAPKLDETWKSGHVYGFDRKRRGPWDLLLAGLAVLLAGRVPGTCRGRNGQRAQERLNVNAPMLPMDIPGRQAQSKPEGT